MICIVFAAPTGALGPETRCGTAVSQVIPALRGAAFWKSQWATIWAVDSHF